MPNSKFTVLVVDDAAVFRQRIIRLLNEQNIHPILQARNFEEAIGCIQNTTVNLILLDISMPGKSGIQLLKLVKSRYAAIRVWMISNHADDYYKQVCMTAGAEHFFDKSLDFEEIEQRLSTIRNEIQTTEIAK